MHHFSNYAGISQLVESYSHKVEVSGSSPDRPTNQYIMEKIIDCDFRLEKDFGIFKKGHIFKSYGGLVSGVDAISFLDKEWFTPVNIAILQATVQ